MFKKFKKKDLIETNLIAPIATGIGTAALAGIGSGYLSHRKNKKRSIQNYYDDMKNYYGDSVKIRKKYNAAGDELQNVIANIKKYNLQIRECNDRECIEKIKNILNKLESRKKLLSYVINRYNLTGDMDSEYFNENNLLGIGASAILGSLGGNKLGKRIGNKSANKELHIIGNFILKKQNDEEQLRAQMQHRVNAINDYVDMYEFDLESCKDKKCEFVLTQRINNLNKNKNDITGYYNELIKQSNYKYDTKIQEFKNKYNIN